MFCTRCGRELEESASFCVHCGTPLENSKKQTLNKSIVFGISAVIVIMLAAVGVVSTAALNLPIYTFVSEKAQSIPTNNQEGQSALESQDQMPGQKEEKFTDEELFANNNPSEQGAASNHSPYILTESSTRYYLDSEVTELSVWELYIARNEIFARHGRGFTNQDLVDYFKAQYWYRELYSPAEFDAMTSPLNDYEKRNIEMITAAEEGRNSPYL